MRGTSIAGIVLASARRAGLGKFGRIPCKETPFRYDVGLAYPCSGVRPKTPRSKTVSDRPRGF